MPPSPASPSTQRSGGAFCRQTAKDHSSVPPFSLRFPTTFAHRTTHTRIAAAVHRSPTTTTTADQRPSIIIIVHPNLYHHKTQQPCPNQKAAGGRRLRASSPPWWRRSWSTGRPRAGRGSHRTRMSLPSSAMLLSWATMIWSECRLRMHHDIAWPTFSRLN